MTWEIIGSDCGGECRVPFDFDAAVRRRLQREAEARGDFGERDTDVNEIRHDDSTTEDEQ